mmetsp:Transcript_33624/g.68270  ORF Transcript_33624/g.68270 Transcript_33624/m.68270 type:complete len:212 (-) Transcript_33624:1043-1678(-)
MLLPISFLTTLVTVAHTVASPTSLEHLLILQLSTFITSYEDSDSLAKIFLTSGFFVLCFAVSLCFSGPNNCTKDLQIWISTLLDSCPHSSHRSRLPCYERQDTANIFRGGSSQVFSQVRCVCPEQVIVACRRRRLTGSNNKGPQCCHQIIRAVGIRSIFPAHPQVDKVAEEPFMITLRVILQVQVLECCRIERFTFLPIFLPLPRETSIAK